MMEKPNLDKSRQKRRFLKLIFSIAFFSFKKRIKHINLHLQFEKQKRA